MSARSWLALVGALTLWARPASSQEHQLALLEADPELDHAAALALAPWGLSVEARQGDSPGAELPGAVRRAKALSGQWAVSIVVWLTSSDEGCLLWVYDAHTDSVSTRQLDACPPFSSPAAASVALTLKSLLRPPEPARVSQPTPPPPVALPERQPRVSLRLGLEQRYVAREVAELRGVLSGVWWLGSRWGIAIAIGRGRGVDLHGALFDAELRQTSFSPSLRWRLLGNRYVATSLLAGGGLHLLELGGKSEALGRSTRASRLTPSVDAGTEITLGLASRATLGLCVKALYFPSRERYLVHGAAVLELWPVAAEFGAQLGVELL